MVHTMQHIDPSRLLISRFRIISIPPAKDDLMGETTFQAVKAGSAMVNPWQPLKQNHPRLPRNGCYGGNSSPILAIFALKTIWVLGFTMGFTIGFTMLFLDIQIIWFSWNGRNGLPTPGHLPFWGTRAADRSRPFFFFLDTSMGWSIYGMTKMKVIWVWKIVKSMVNIVNYPNIIKYLWISPWIYWYLGIQQFKLSRSI